HPVCDSEGRRIERREDRSPFDLSSPGADHEGPLPVFSMHEIDKVIAACRSVSDTGKRGVLVTVIRTQGSTYRRAGARAVIGEDGTLAGAISGGCLERDIAERVAMWLADMNPRLVTYDSTRGDD